MTKPTFLYYCVEARGTAGTLNQLSCIRHGSAVAPLHSCNLQPQGGSGIVELVNCIWSAFCRLPEKKNEFKKTRLKSGHSLVIL